MIINKNHFAWVCNFNDKQFLWMSNLIDLTWPKAEKIFQMTGNALKEMKSVENMKNDVVCQ